MEFNGLPLHPLVVHAAVVLAPAAAAAGVAYAAVPRWRWLLRWPLVLLAVGSAGALYVAKLAGESLRDERFAEVTGELGDQIALHEERGNLLVWVALGFLVVALFAAWALGGPSALASGRGARDTQGTALGWVAVVLVIAGALALAGLTALTGDAGSRAVWGL